MREFVGQVEIGQSNYFDCPIEVTEKIEQEIEAIVARKPALIICKHDRGVHDRGFQYIVYQVSSRRPFDSETESIARYLDTLAHHWFAESRGQDACRWHIEGFDNKCYSFDWDLMEATK